MSSPAAESPQQADLAKESPEEKTSSKASPADCNSSRSPASSSSDTSSSSDDEADHNGALRKIRSSVAQIKVSWDVNIPDICAVQ